MLNYGLMSTSKQDGCSLLDIFSQQNCRIYELPSKTKHINHFRDTHSMSFDSLRNGHLTSTWRDITGISLQGLQVYRKYPAKKGTITEGPRREIFPGKE